MCDPVSISLAAFGLSAGTAIWQHEEGVKAAERQSEALVEADALQQMDLERQRTQQQEQSAEEMNAAHRAALSDLASLDALTGEYGGGNTANRARGIAEIQQGETLATVASNARKGLAETSYTSASSRRNTLAQIRAINAPSRVGTLLSIANSGAQAYSGYQQGKRLDAAAAGNKAAK